MAGPVYYLSEDGVVIKAWIALFTCVVVRAVHLEFLPDMSAASLQNALSRFFSLRGQVSRIKISDNGRNFVRTARAIRRMAQNDSTRNYLLQKRIEWCFNAPYAPWWGWFFERMMRTTKEFLRKAVGRAKPTQDGLATVLAEAVHIINSRPLLQPTQDGGNEEPLTPALLLHGISSTLLPSDFAMNRLRVAATASHIQQQEKLR